MAEEDPASPFDPSDFILRQQQSSVARAVTSVDEDPEAAARAIEVGDAIGVHPAVVHGDLETYETQHKAALTAQLLRNNSFLADYAQSHPLAPVLSNDDWGQLDAVSHRVKRLAGMGLRDSPEGNHPISEAAISAFKEGFDSKSIPEEYSRLYNYVNSPLWRQVVQQYGALPAAGLVLPQKLFMGALFGLGAGLGETAAQVTGDPDAGIKATRDAIVGIQMYLSKGGVGFHGLHPEMATAINEAVQLGKTVKPYIDAGKEPPVGLHKVIDDAKKEVSKLDLSNLDEAVKEAGKSATRERNPAIFADFVRQHTQADVYISAEAVRRLYGDKEPAPDDGKLGFVQMLKEQLAASEPINGDVAVPLYAYLAYIDPAIHKELKDDIRVRQGGLTKEEMTGLKAPEVAEPVEGEPAPAEPIVAAIRQAAGLKPLPEEAVAPKLTLKRVSTRELDGLPVHTFEIRNQDGSLGTMAVITEERDGKRLFVDTIEGLESDKGKFGPEAIRQLLSQLAAEFPNAETIAGLKVGGSRRVAGTEGKVEIKIPKPKPKPEPPSTEGQPFATAPPGMTLARYRNYQALIEQQLEKDFEATAKRIEDKERKRQSKEWRERRQALRPDVVREIQALPEIQAEDFFTKAKLRSESLTREQEATLKGMTAKEGMDPDLVAGNFGYATGDELVNALVQLRTERGKARKEDFVRKMIDAETDRQMEAKYGNFDENLLNAIKDQVLSETELDRLHEETVYLAELSNSATPLPKEALKAGMNEALSRKVLDSVSSDILMSYSGKASRALEDAAQKGDWTEAFKQSQYKELAIMQAKEAMKIEAQKEKFDATMKRMQKREIPGLSQEYTNFIHDLMVRLGQKVNRSVQDIAAEIERTGFKSLDKFNDSKSADLRDLHLPDWLLDPNFKQDLGDLSVAQFRELDQAIKAMIHNGRDELKVEKAGEKQDLNAVLDQMVEQMASLGEKEHPIDRKPSKVIDTVKSYWWSGITVESMLNRIDRDSPKGLMYQYITDHFTYASNYKDKLIRDYQKKLSAIAKIDKMDKLVDNPLFVDPISEERFVMRRRNVLGILQNVGNESNMKKLSSGYDLKPEQIMEWLGKVTTKEDWDRAQAIGDIFNEIFEMANEMSHKISGVGIQGVDIKPIQTPFGTYKGWYNPVKYDPLRPGQSKTLLGSSIEENGYYRATTPQGYTEQRTGYIAPVELNLDIVPTRMQQMLHDIAVRPAVIQLSKFFYNPKFKSAMIKSFGKHQAEEMIPFLKDFANASNFQSMAAQHGNAALEYFRQNTIATLIGFNPGTVGKHGLTAAFNSLTEVGPLNWSREFKNIISDTVSGRENWRMAMEKSEELQRRMRNFAEIFQGHGSEINLRGAKSTFGSYRDFMISAGATPVSISDLLSAVPTWLAEYKNQLAKGETEGFAVSAGNRAIRRAHGSSVLTNRPSISRTNALGATFSSLYGFFSHMQQKQYELAWKAKDVWQGEKSGDVGTKRHIPSLVAGFMSYIIIPALVEEMITPYTNAEKESGLMKLVKILTLGGSSSYIGVRDYVRALINVRDPSAGLIGTTLKMLMDLPRDLASPHRMDKQQAGKILHHTFALGGVLTGLTNEQEGKLAEYAYRYARGLEKPKGLPDVLSGIRHGFTGKKR